MSIGLQDFIALLARNRERLAALWPQVRSTLGHLPDAERTRAQTDWNAAVYVQRKLELQVVAGLRGKPGVRIVDQPETPALGVYAGLPGDPAMGAPPASDARFAVPRIEVEWPLVSGAAAGVLIPAAVAVGAWIILGAGALLLVLKVTGALDLVERHWAHTTTLQAQTRQYQVQVAAQSRNYAAQVQAAGQPIPAPPAPLAPPKPPKPPSGWGSWIMPTALAAGGIGAFVWFSRARG